MRSILILITALTFFLTSSISLAKSSPKKKQFNTEVVNSTASLLKSSKTLKGFLKSLNGYYSSKDIRKAKRLLLKEDVSTKVKIPAFKVRGSKIIFDQKNYIDFVSPNLIVANGIKLKKSKKGFSDNLALVIKEMKKKQRKLSWFQRLFFTEAYAMNTMQGLIAAVAGGAVGAISGERYFGWNRWTGAALGVGAVYLLTELIQSNRKGQVSCSSGGDYQIRQKSRNGIFMATASYNTVPEATLTSAGLPTTCNSSRAAELASFLGTGVGTGRSSGTNTQPTGATMPSGAIL